jgi:drug/metabolite transporter (DMT)-like permease
VTGLALGLVLAAAAAHATWNYLAKRAGGGVEFIWLFGAFASVLYAPLAIRILVVDKPSLGWVNVAMILASAVVHSIYFTLLGHGYRIGDLSLVYPIARGTAPLISAVIGILFLNEKPSAVAGAGIILMAVGIFAVSGFRFRRRAPSAGKAALVALACGTAISTYTVMDKVSVSVLRTPPLVLDWGTNLGRFLMMTPFALRDKEKLKKEWELHRGHAAGVAVLSSLAYILVLFAMTFTPVSYIAPAREISILIGAVIGAKFLSEENAKSRVIGTAAMVAGLAALALG